MDTIKIEFTEDEISALTNALRVAAVRFDDDAQMMEETDGHAPLAETFRKQAKEAREFADRADAAAEAAYVAAHPDVE